MKKWELARYLIDAKKCIDSVLYIGEHAEELHYYDLKTLIDEKRNTFYINCCAVIEHTIASKTQQKHYLCENDEIVELLFRERDKNSAHKDENYIPQEFNRIAQIAGQMKTHIIHVREICKDYIPKELTLDFVSHDKALFRAVHKLLAEDEEKILDKKHPLRNTTMQTNEEYKSINVLNDTIDLRKISEEKRKEYGVVLKEGIDFQEGIQECQDFCIRLNLLFGEKTWCTVNEKEVKRMNELTKLGCYDEYGVIQPPPTDPILLARIEKLLKSK